jgi:arylsulfatase A-like enzyme
VLVVIDTLRASAVSAHGVETGTTPHLDAMAAEGLDYRRAYAPAPWTLPSHASLLTGLGVEVHGVGLRGRLTLPEEIVTLAERFAAAGYDTAAFSENMLVSDTFDLLQGFAHRRHTQVYKKEVTQLAGDVLFKLDVERHVGEWLAQRDTGRPFFLFVNIADPHNPYTVVDENRFVDPDLSRTELGRYAKEPQQMLCELLPSKYEVDVLRGLYLGEVVRADAKVVRLAEQVSTHLGASRNLITVVTSDHGEMFGERRLLGHEFSLHDALLHIPLIVHGLPDPPAVIEEPVTLVDVASSLLRWAGIDGAPMSAARLLPTRDAPNGTGAQEGGSQPRSFFAAYSDNFAIRPEDWSGVVEFLDKSYPRRGCGGKDKVFGGMASLRDASYKFHWFERYEPELYDLRWDPDERFDLAGQQPERVQQYRSRIEAIVDAAGVTAEPDPAGGLTPDAAEALRALGYLDERATSE